MELSDLDVYTRQLFAISNTVSSGVVVIHVDRGAVADNRDIQTGDVISFSDDRDFGSTVRYIQALKSRGEKSVSLSVYNRQGEYRFADLLLPLEDNEKQSVTVSPVAKAPSPEVEAATAPAIKAPSTLVVTPLAILYAPPVPTKMAAPSDVSTPLIILNAPPVPTETAPSDVRKPKRHRH
jgi:hypothetical protein